MARQSRFQTPIKVIARQATVSCRYLSGRGMNRRDFITLLGAATWPFAAAAQQTNKMPTVGYLGAGSQAGWNTWTTAFVQRMRELGWIDGRTVSIEYRWAEGRGERFAEISAEFVRLKVDVIVTVGSAVP